MLLAAARLLPTGDSLRTTLDLWGAVLAGCDTDQEFVRVTKARLVLFALHRGASANGYAELDLNSAFPHIQVKDGLQSLDWYPGAQWIALNPPYGYVDAPHGCSWASGKVTEAAVFLGTCLRRCAPGTRITAILPDVLRAGTRYGKWRQMVAEQSSITRVTPYGLFNHGADVDVFILDLLKRRRATRKQERHWLGIRTASRSTLADKFVVHVGPVVPHRHPSQGTPVPYIHARALPPWERVNRIKERRGFGGKLFRPPFVAIRRTSRPEDAYRAIGTLVADSRRVAVENHVILCIPYDGTIAACQHLLRMLKSKHTNQWLNHRIRCRHLTVAAVRQLPLQDCNPARKASEV